MAPKDDSHWERPRERHERSRQRQRRKEHVLHTRISDQLADDIRRVAEDLRVPVSNLVRNVLEEAFSAVERVTGDVGDLLEEVIDEAERASERMRSFQERRRRERAPGTEPAEAAEPARPAEPRPAAPPAPSRPAPPDEFPEVMAWQRVTLNREQPCAVDGRRLEAGGEAFVGLTDQGLSRRVLCPRCMESLRPTP